jgi:hypothetical protein
MLGHQLGQPPGGVPVAGVGAGAQLGQVAAPGQQLGQPPGGVPIARPAGSSERMEQEMWALLAVYQALRIAVTDAVQAVPGADPDRASYQIAVQTAQNLVTTAAGITGPAGDLPGRIGRAVLASLHPPRRPRVCARRVKSPLSRWNKQPPGKPRAPKKITAITAEIRRDQPDATRRTKSVTNHAGP